MDILFSFLNRFHVFLCFSLVLIYVLYWTILTNRSETKKKKTQTLSPHQGNSNKCYMKEDLCGIVPTLHTICKFFRRVLTMGKKIPTLSGMQWDEEATLMSNEIPCTPRFTKGLRSNDLHCTLKNIVSRI